MNKVRQSNSFTFTWYKEGIDSNKNSDLINLINKRAKLTYPDLTDVFESFFPKKYYENDIYTAMLDYTRHIPRDFIQLMNYIQANCHSGCVTTDVITKGINEYSTEYFLPEIENELSGYLPGDAIQPVFKVISSIRSQSFTYEQFREKCQNYTSLRNLDTIEILRILYDCSAIGHIHHYDDGKTKVLYKYRNRATAFEQTDKILLHRGLWKSMNVNY